MFQFGKGGHSDFTGMATPSQAMKMPRNSRATQGKKRAADRRTPPTQRAAARRQAEASPIQSGSASRRGDRARARRAGPPDLLHHLEEPSLSALAPGDVWLIEEEGSASAGDDGHVFFAVLGCPLCGAPTLITLAQYFGVSPVMCGSKVCAALFRIADQNRFVYLPVN